VDVDVSVDVGAEVSVVDVGAEFVVEVEVSVVEVLEVAVVDVVLLVFSSHLQMSTGQREPLS